MEATLLIRNMEDYQYFGALLDGEDAEKLSPDEEKEREIMTLLLKVKNGPPAQSEPALMELTDRAQEFGAGPLFHHVLPLLMLIPTWEQQERLLLVKVLNGVLIKLNESVGPYAHQILVVIEPMLITDDDNTRVLGGEVISNLSKAAGLANMIAAMRPDIDCIDKNVRKMTAIAFSFVASALGISVVLPFLKGVCESKKSWEALQTGMKIVQEIAILMGSAVVPHLSSLVEITGHGLDDENQKVRSIANLSLDALAEAAAPNGIDRIDSLLRNLQVWRD